MAAKLTPFKLKFRFDDPDEVEQFLQGLIVAQSNNSSKYFPQIINAVNGAMTTYRKEKLEGEMTARAEAGMP